MTDRRRRQKDNKAARRQAEKKAETRKEVFRRIGFALLMGTALVRTDPKGRDFRTLLHEDLFAPLRMDSTSMGLRPDLEQLLWDYLVRAAYSLVNTMEQP